MAPKFKFAEGEKVICFHGPLLYEAKCIKVSDKTKEKDRAIKYLVHYQGWSKNWDEWVPENRVLKFNDQNLQKQKELNEAHNITKKGRKSEKRKKTITSAAASAPLNQSTSGQPLEKEPSPISTSGKTKTSQLMTLSSTASIDNSKKRKLDPYVENEESFSLKLEVKIKIPDELKPWLVDDWDLVTRQKKLFELPARVNVDQIIDDYIKSKRVSNNKNKESTLIEVTNGIKEYFNVMLGSQLLYRFERPQYKSIIDQYEDDQNMSSIYGPIYLLRFFVKLGSNLVFTTLDEKSIQLILAHIHDFLKFLVKNISYFSHNDYKTATPEYHRKFNLG